MVPFVVCRPLRAILPALCVSALLSTFAQGQQVTYSSEHRHAERFLPQKATASEQKLKQKLALGRQGLSLVTADFDQDGSNDLISGYATGNSGVLLLQRGVNAAVAPGPSERALLAAGQTVMPYVEKAEAIDLPARPDLLVAADLAGRGHVGLLAAARNATSVYILAGDGHGGFSSPAEVALSGKVSSLAVRRGLDSSNLILAGVCGAAGCGVQVLDADGQTLAFVRSGSPVTSMLVKAINVGGLDDLILLTANSVQVVHGPSLLDKTSAPHVSRIPVASAVAVDTGMFAYDRRGYAQIAVLGEDATVHIFACAGTLDTSFLTREESYPLMARGKLTPPRPAVPPVMKGVGWQEVETVHNAGPGGKNAIMLRGRFSGWGNDDLTILAGGQYITIAHPTATNGRVRSAIPVVKVDSQENLAVAAIATRISDDARLGVVTMSDGVHPLVLIPPTGGRSMTVTTTSDYPANANNMAVCNGTNAASGTTQCSLRAAVGVTNADFSTNGAGTMTIDKIVLPAGTYQITITNNGGTATDEYGSVDYHYDVDGPVNIVGAGQGTTIIEAGTTGYNGSTFGNGIDSLFEQNSQVVNPAGTFYMSLSNLTLANGRNPNIQSASNGYITNFYGGALDFDAYGGGVLTVTNVTVTNNSIVDGAGGGLDVFNTNGTTTALQGGVDVENSIVTYNQSPFAAGGLFVFDHMLTTINNSTFSYNSATKGSSNQTDSEGLDNVGGGGVYIAGTDGFAALNVTNSTIKNNTTDGIGGGFTYFSGATITNTVFDSNSAAGFGGAFIPGRRARRSTRPASR